MYLQVGGGLKDSWYRIPSQNGANEIYLEMNAISKGGLIGAPPDGLWRNDWQCNYVLAGASAFYVTWAGLFPLNLNGTVGYRGWDAGAGCLHTRT